MVGIYKVTSPTGRIYIGQAIDVNKRFDSYERIDSSVKNQRKLYNSLMKYGPGLHRFEYIEECNELDLNFFERKWQDYYNVTGKKGMNCKLTKTNDKSGNVSDETREKMSIARIGMKFSKEHCKNLSIYGKKRAQSPEFIIQQRINSGNSKKVLKISTGEIYYSATEAARQNNVTDNMMKKWLQGRTMIGRADYKYINENEK